MSDDPFVTPSNRPKQPAGPPHEPDLDDEPPTAATSHKAPVVKQGADQMHPALPSAAPDFDDEPLTAPAKAMLQTPEHWPEEEAPAATVGDFTIMEGELMQAVEWYFPLFWALCLIIVSYIGIYYAVDKLAGANPLPPAWF